MGQGWSPLARLYAALALVSAAVPYLILTPWLQRHGLDVQLFARGLFATTPASVFVADVLIAATIFLFFVVVEGRRLGMRHLWLPVFLVVAVGLCCALPTFLAMRERALGGAGSYR